MKSKATAIAAFVLLFLLAAATPPLASFLHLNQGVQVDRSYLLVSAAQLFLGIGWGMSFFARQRLLIRFWTGFFIGFLSIALLLIDALLAPHFRLMQLSLDYSLFPPVITFNIIAVVGQSFLTFLSIWVFSRTALAHAEGPEASAEFVPLEELASLPRAVMFDTDLPEFDEPIGFEGEPFPAPEPAFVTTEPTPPPRMAPPPKTPPAPQVEVLVGAETAAGAVAESRAPDSGAPWAPAPVPEMPVPRASPVLAEPVPEAAYGSFDFDFAPGSPEAAPDTSSTYDLGTTDVPSQDFNFSFQAAEIPPQQSPGAETGSEAAAFDLGALDFGTAAAPAGDNTGAIDLGVDITMESATPDTPDAGFDLSQEADLDLGAWGSSAGGTEAAGVEAVPSLGKADLSGYDFGAGLGEALAAPTPATVDPGTPFTAFEATTGPELTPEPVYNFMPAEVGELGEYQLPEALEAPPLLGEQEAQPFADETFAAYAAPVEGAPGYPAETVPSYEAAPADISPLVETEFMLDDVPGGPSDLGPAAPPTYQEFSAEYVSETYTDTAPEYDTEPYTEATAASEASAPAEYYPPEAPTGEEAQAYAESYAEVPETAAEPYAGYEIASEAPLEYATETGYEAAAPEYAAEAYAEAAPEYGVETYAAAAPDYSAEAPAEYALETYEAVPPEYVGEAYAEPAPEYAAEPYGEAPQEYTAEAGYETTAPDYAPEANAAGTAPESYAPAAYDITEATGAEAPAYAEAEGLTDEAYAGYEVPAEYPPYPAEAPVEFAAPAGVALAPEYAAESTPEAVPEYAAESYVATSDEVGAAPTGVEADETVSVPLPSAEAAPLEIPQADVPLMSYEQVTARVPEGVWDEIEEDEETKNRRLATIRASFRELEAANKELDHLLFGLDRIVPPVQESPAVVPQSLDELMRITLASLPPIEEVLTPIMAAAQASVGHEQMDATFADAEQFQMGGGEESLEYGSALPPESAQQIEEPSVAPDSEEQ